MVPEYVLYSGTNNLLSGANMSAQPPLPPEFLTDLRAALLPRAAVYASEIGVLVQETARKHGLSILLRDLGGARLFVDTHLSDLLERDRSPEAVGPRLRYISKATLVERPAIQTSRPAPEDVHANAGSKSPGNWWPADGSDPSFWDRFNNPLRAARFSLTKEGVLFWAESLVAMPEGAQQIQPMTFDDYRQMALRFAESMHDAALRDPMLRVSQDSSNQSFSSEWFRVVGRLGQRRLWETTRIAGVVEALRRRLSDAGADTKTADLYTSELTRSRDAAKHRRGSARHRIPYLPDKPTEVSLRQLLADLAQVLNEEEIRHLSVPLGKVIDVLHRGDSSK